MLGWLALIVSVLAGLFTLFQSNGHGLDGISAWPIAAGVLSLLLALYLSTFRANWRDRRGLKIGFSILFLTLTGGALFLIFKDEARLRSTFQASRNADDELSQRGVAGPVAVMVRRNTDGKFVAQGDINGMPASLLIDTGASTVMLKSSDAESAGIDVKTLSFTTPIQTANGTVYAAPVRVRSLSIGLLHMTDIEALVAQPGSLNENLLGMSFLRRLTSYDMSRDFLTLRE